jgi:hypothetical protein
MRCEMARSADCLMPATRSSPALARAWLAWNPGDLAPCDHLSVGPAGESDPDRHATKER